MKGGQRDDRLDIEINFLPDNSLCRSLLSPGVRYENALQIILVGVVIALVGHTMEVLLLRTTTVTISTVLDLLASFAIVYLSKFFFSGARITFWGALLTAFLIAAGEYVQHQYLTRTHKTRKSD
jgi:cation transport ATPase